MRRFRASPHRATLKGHKTFISHTASLPEVAYDQLPFMFRTQDQQKLKAILARCPELEAATGHVRSFATMMAIRSASRLPEWIAAA